MPVIFQKAICREDLIRNRQVLYVFGDNVERKGLGGQARHMRHEPNAVGVATKYTPYSFFSEDPGDVVTQNRIIDEDMKRLFEKVKAGGVVVWPASGIGVLRAELAERAPSTWDHLQQKLAALLKAADLFSKENP